MPLRAKITNSAFAAQQMQPNTQIPTELPGDEPDDVLFSSIYGVRTIELNRPKKLNSLNGSMIRKIVPRLREWEKSSMANVIIMKGAGDRALCAGGDVAALAQCNQQGAEGQEKSKTYFGEEYKLDHLIATYSKPYIAFMDGITMGGGVGLSIHAPFRIATERTVFAMPETTIGFFPDVGGSFFLPRMDGCMGKYLALTSSQLKGVNAFFHGIATHYLHSSSLPDLEKRLAELTFKDYATLDQRYKIINATIEEFVTSLPHDQRPEITGKQRNAIDSCFAFDDINKILSKLDSTARTEDKGVAEWANKTSITIRGRSPTSVKVTLKAMELGLRWDIAQTFKREHKIASVFMEHHDFVEGVSARLIRKPAEQPKWQPSSLEEVDWKAVDNFFVLNGGDTQLELLNETSRASYNTYPHAWIGLPTENDVRLAVQEKGASSAKDVVRQFIVQREGKIGVKEKVSEILARKTTAKDGKLVWNEPTEESSSTNNTPGSQDPTEGRRSRR